MNIACSTCLECFTANCNVCATSCGHVFHINCLAKWLKKGQRTCPQCRTPIQNAEQLRKIYFAETDSVKGFDNNADADAALQANLKCFKLEEEKRLLKKEVDDLKMTLTNQSDLFEQKQSELKKHFEDYRKWCFSTTKSPKVQPQKLQPPTCFPLNDSQISLGRNQSSQDPRNIPLGTPTTVPIQIPNQNPQGRSSVSYTGSNLKDLKHPILGYSIPISPIPQSPLPLSPLARCVGRSENLGGQSIIKDLLMEQNLLLVGPKSASTVPPPVALANGGVLDCFYTRPPVALANKRKFELSEKRIQESEKRRKIEENRQTAANISHDLFVAPIKLDRNPTSVEKVLGRFDQIIVESVDKDCIGKIGNWKDYESQNIYGRGMSYSHFYNL